MTLFISIENKSSRSGTPSLEAVFVQTGLTWELDLLPTEEEALVIQAQVMVGEELTVVTAGELDGLTMAEEELGIITVCVLDRGRPHRCT